jgi:hypothetical protein
MPSAGFNLATTIFIYLRQISLNTFCGHRDYHTRIVKKKKITSPPPNHDVILIMLAVQFLLLRRHIVLVSPLNRRAD